MYSLGFPILKAISNKKHLHMAGPIKRMVENLNFKLSRLQFFLLLFITQTGSSFFSFPAPFINVVGRDAWLVFLVAGVLHYLLLLYYERNYMYFNFGPFVGWLYKGYWLFVAVVYLASSTILWQFGGFRKHLNLSFSQHWLVFRSMQI